MEKKNNQNEKKLNASKLWNLNLEFILYKLFF